jgi:hypothetical protein
MSFLLSLEILDVTDFWLGTHKAAWLARTDVPLFVSHRTLRDRRAYPRATCSWAQDSGAFTEISMHGAWTFSPKVYAENTRRHAEEIGSMEWAAVQDWMCEPFILQKTGLSVEEHQRRTVRSLLELREADPRIDWVPVLQGWEPDDYLRHVDVYDRAGVDLVAEPIVGLGSVCRRQSTTLAERVIERLSEDGIRLHGFGFKLNGLMRCAKWLASADSMAWSYNARRNPPLPECPHASCASCLVWALRWRRRVVEMVDRAKLAPVQGRLFAEVG